LAPEPPRREVLVAPALACARDRAARRQLEVHLHVVVARGEARRPRAYSRMVGSPGTSTRRPSLARLTVTVVPSSA
jgi:hypothetical protein